MSYAILPLFFAVEILGRGADAGAANMGRLAGLRPRSRASRGGLRKGRNMVRKVVIALATVVAVVAGPTFTAWARDGGGPSQGGPSQGGPSQGGPSRGGFTREDGFHGGAPRGGHFERFEARRPGAFHHDRFAFRGRYDRHHRFHRRFIFLHGFRHAYYDPCYRRVWTPVGWRWRYLCY